MASRRIYEDPRWRRVRRYVLARDGHRCYWCGGYGNERDHVVSVVEGGSPFSPANLVCSCKNCNTSRGNHVSRARRRGVSLGARRRLTAEGAFGDTLGDAAVFGAIRER